MPNTVIYVSPGYDEQPDDVVLYSFGRETKLSVVDPYLYKSWVISDAEVISRLTDIHSDALLEQAQRHIHTYYPSLQQARDATVFSLYTSKFKGLGVFGVEESILKACSEVKQGKNLEVVVDSAVSSLGSEVLAKAESLTKLYGVDKPNYINYMFRKLVVISLKNDWAEACIFEAENASDSGVHMLLPEYPTYLKGV